MQRHNCVESGERRQPESHSKPECIAVNDLLPEHSLAILVGKIVLKEAVKVPVYALVDGH